MCRPDDFPPYEVKKIPLDEFFQEGIDSGMLKAKPRSGKCMFCGNDLTEKDTDHSVCNTCWTATFACSTCGDESGDCEHQQ